MKRSLKDYLQRFAPWIALTWKKRAVDRREVAVRKKLRGNAANLCEQLLTLLQKVSENAKLHGVEPSALNCQALGYSGEDQAAQWSREFLLSEWGYIIGRRRSNIPGAGRGVFVTDGVVCRGQVVALYPGTLYYPGDRLLVQSLWNPFILRCSDGVMVDGKDTGLSRSIYKSCLQRDRCGPHLMGDLTWLTERPILPLSVGQYVNNFTQDFPANVEYEEIDIAADDIPLEHLSLLPYASFSPRQKGNLLRCVPLVALRDIHCGEELFSMYFTEV